MINRKVFAVGLLSLACSIPAFAAVSADEAAKLGGELTEFGSVKAGSADGSIPAYTGGETKIPAGLDTRAGKWVDLYAGEKPLYRITADNVEKYGDKVSDGIKQLLKDNKDYYLDVYPTHRSVVYPDSFLQATKRNATTCHTTENGLAVEANCRGGLPFPIPKTGNEVMWNKLLSYWGDQAWLSEKTSYWMLNQDGKPVLTNLMRPYTEKPYYQTQLSDRPEKLWSRLIGFTEGPSRKAGEINGTNQFIDPLADPRKAWQYTTGQRRVKLAPEFSYDTPMAVLGGAMFYDELFMFDGTMDRFDFKLVGKKEMLINANNYNVAFNCKVDRLFVGHHVNPECERWELRRVWVVEATLKPGMRHANSKRRYYFDEDSYIGGLMDGWDQAGKLTRTGINYYVVSPDVKAQGGGTFVVYNFNRGMLAFQSDLSTDPKASMKYVDPLRDSELSPEFVSSGGLR
ncbi:TPA: DUF1329 domain-containing protein [Pseudomonas aeruginosa]